MKTLASALALGLLSLAAACGDDSATSTSGGGGEGPGSGGSDAGTGGDASTPSSSGSSNPQSSQSSSQSTASGEGGSGDGGSGVGGNGTGAGSGTGGSNGCRDAAPADRDRYVVVGHPFGSKDYVNDWEVLALSAGGVLTTTGTHFEMGIAEDARIAFTPDGQIGVAVQNDGTLGIFSIDDQGQVTVIDPGFGGDFYADNLTMAPDGSAVIVGDANTTENGGGLHRIDLDCVTGTPSYGGLLVDVNNAWGVVDLGDGRWAVASQGGALGVEDGSDVTDLREGDPWTIADGADPFPYDGVTVGAFGADRDQSYLLVGDFSGFGAQPNNLAFVSIEADGLTASDAVIPMDSPYSVSISPEGEVAVVVSYFGDAIYVVDVDPTSNTPISYRGEVDYEGDATLLPGKLTTVDRGSLLGLTLVAELYGVRVISFDGDGVVTDHGVTLTPGGELSNGSPTAIGVQP